MHASPDGGTAGHPAPDLSGARDDAGPRGLRSHDFYDGQSSVIIETRPVGPFAINVFVVGCPETRVGAIIDSGGDLRWAQRVVERHQLDIRLLLQTHGHIDHVAGLAENKRAWPQAAVCLHPDERPIYVSAPQQGRMFGMPVEAPPEPDRWLSEGDRVEVGTLRFEVLATPGHTPGHVVFHETSQGVLFTGDLLFAGSIGRTDFPGGDYRAILRSLARVAALAPETRVFSGHGPETTIGEERARNPFLQDL